MVHAWTVREVAKAFGCSASHISRVEQGHNRPSRQLVLFYEETFDCDGLLLSLLEIVENHGEQQRRRPNLRPGDSGYPLPGDKSEFVGDTIPHGTVLEPGGFFVKTWWVRNGGTVPWSDRQLERQGPLTGPGLITSLRYVPIPDTKPGEIARIFALLKAPTYDCSSIAYFKMANRAGVLCFPGRHQLGLDVLVRVSGQKTA